MKRLSNTEALVHSRMQSMHESRDCRQIANGWVESKTSCRDGIYHTEERFLPHPESGPGPSTLRDAIDTCKG